MEAWMKLLEGARLTEEEKRQICHEMMTTEPRMEQLIIKHFTEETFRQVKARWIGGGLIGGKACGLLVARRLIERNLPELRNLIEPHDSFFIGSNVFCEYLEENDCLERKIKKISPPNLNSSMGFMISLEFSAFDHCKSHRRSDR